MSYVRIYRVHPGLTFRSKLSRAKVIKPASTAESIDLGVNVKCAHSHCTKKLSGLKWGFDQWKRGIIG